MTFLLHVVVLNAQGKTEHNYAAYEIESEARTHQEKWHMNSPGCESSVVDTFMIEYRTLDDFPDMPLGILAEILRAIL